MYNVSAVYVAKILPDQPGIGTQYGLVFETHDDQGTEVRILFRSGSPGKLGERLATYALEPGESRLKQIIGGKGRLNHPLNFIPDNVGYQPVIVANDGHEPATLLPISSLSRDGKPSELDEIVTSMAKTRLNG